MRSPCTKMTSRVVDEDQNEKAQGFFESASSLSSIFIYAMATDLA